MAMLGREVVWPTTLIARPPDEPMNVTVPFVQDFRDTLRAAHDRVRQATRSATKIQKTHFDRQVKIALRCQSKGLIILAKATFATTLQKAATFMDRALAYSVVQKPSFCSNTARKDSQAPNSAY